ncbi:VOC family protein [Streptomyces sp. NPDC048248]|uniref:VOC family protein n=1 Tax=Streptomyces sp. NPDC048248 TaxID=3365523 RepID=UPI003718B6CE
MSAEGNTMAQFEIFANDFAPMRTFYESVFGWTFVRNGSRWAISTGDQGPGIDGSMVELTEKITIGTPGCTLRMVVSDAQETYGAVFVHGGKMQSSPLPVPDVGLLAFGEDPDGNVFEVVQLVPDEPPYQA